MRTYYADLHIHIGRTEAGQPVKISGSRDLTFYNIAREASERKGIDIVGIIDCQSPAVQQEIEAYIRQGEMAELPGGGIAYKNTTVLLGSELEVKDPGFAPVHLLAFLPTLSAMKDFTEWLASNMKNVNLSSQRVYVPARRLQEEATGRGGIMIPAHIFTPHKGLYGTCARVSDILDPEDIAAVELGLSSNTEMAEGIPDLAPYPFVTNSDAHSLGKIAREYNALRLEEPTYEEVLKALRSVQGRRIEANYGLEPRLGKYHRTYCETCDTILTVLPEEQAAHRCPACGGTKIVRGVFDRIAALSGLSAESDRKPPRPPYRSQVPLEFVPGLGPKKRQLLLEAFGTEMNVLHRTTQQELAGVVGEELASVIEAARTGATGINSGGGGKYGKLSFR